MTIDEKSSDGAPAWYGSPEADAWAAGYNAAILAYESAKQKEAEWCAGLNVDAAARYLRETLQAGKRLTPWENTPKATKKKWIALAEGALLSAGGEGQ
jgi:hypothetical protein